MNKLLEQIDPNRVPEHVAIIMDGNGRWAKKQGKDRIFGHQNGVRAVRNAAESAAEAGVSYLTLYAFSTENWSRPQEEVNALMELFVETIKNEVPTLMKNQIALKCIGDTASLPENCYNDLCEAIEKTKNNKKLYLIIAVSYSAKWDITQAVKTIADKYKTGTINEYDISQACISKHLTTAPYPDPSLLIRTGGEQRISNFLLWEMAYTELYFTEKHWPEFEKNDFFEAILDFQKRERRFGKISEQIDIP